MELYYVFVHSTGRQNELVNTQNELTNYIFKFTF